MDAEGYSDYKDEVDGDEDYVNNNKKKQRSDTQRIYVPSELILEFLSRLPIKSLTRLSCTSKYIYTHINQNPDFAKYHMINHSQKHPSLVFYVLNGKYGTKNHHNSMVYRNVLQDHQNNNDGVDYHETVIHKTTGIYEYTRWEFGGYCNGLVCFINLVTPITLTIDVWNCTTRELISILPPVIEHFHPHGNGYYPMSCGFGLDSINNEYKFVFFVLMIRTKTLKCLVYTFGIKSSWTEVSLPTYHYPTENHASRLATFASYGGGGALFWRTRDPQIILLFDLHEHKLENTRLPVGRDEYRLFEHKGILGVAVLGKQLPLVIGTSTTTTLEKVHLKILEDYKQGNVWVKLETIDLSSFSIPFTRDSLLVSISDEILLYWRDTCRSFQFFNLHKKCLKVVKDLDPCFFGRRLRQWLTGLDHYWLHCEVENMCSLKTLLPRRARRVSTRDSLEFIMENGCHQMWLMPKPKTVLGGVFTSYYQSKSNEHYWFDG